MQKLLLLFRVFVGVMLYDVFVSIGKEGGVTRWVSFTAVLALPVILFKYTDDGKDNVFKYQ